MSTKIREKEINTKVGTQTDPLTTPPNPPDHHNNTCYPAYSDSRQPPLQQGDIQGVEIPEFKKVLEKTRFPGDEKHKFDDFQLPGTWGKGEIDCGNLMNLRCSDQCCPGRKVVTRCCNKITCKRCWKMAVARMTKRIVRGKMLPYIYHHKTNYHLKSNRNRTARPMHVIFSLPEKLRDAPLLRVRREVAKVAKDIGLYSFLSVVHPWRAKKEGWKDGAHVHLIAWGWVSPKAQKKHVSKGWVIKNKGVIRTDESLYRTTFYLLTHCATHPGKSSYQYYGEIQRFKGKKIEDENHECPVCQSIMLFNDTDQYELQIGRAPPREPGEYVMTSSGLVPYSIMKNT